MKLNHHIKKGKLRLHDGTVMVDLEQEPACFSGQQVWGFIAFPSICHVCYCLIAFCQHVAHAKHTSNLGSVGVSFTYPICIFDVDIWFSSMVNNVFHCAIIIALQISCCQIQWCCLKERDKWNIITNLFNTTKTNLWCIADVDINQDPHMLHTTNAFP